MKAFKGVFLTVALLSSVPVLTLLAPSGHAQQSGQWHVLVSNPAPLPGDPMFLRVASEGDRSLAYGKVEKCRDAGLTGVHAIPNSAYELQSQMGLVADANPEANICSFPNS
jgi:hypothetical protein